MGYSLPMQALGCYPASMPATGPRGRGRPATGTQYPHRLVFYASDDDLEVLQRLAQRLDRSQAGVVRHILREKGRELGLLPDGDEED